MFRRKEIPVYMFTGLLESGKTSFIRDTFAEGEFNDGLKSLLIMCEEGIEEINPALLKKNKTETVTVEDLETLTEDYFDELESTYKPDRILIENNGMWNPEDIAGEFPENWMLVQVIATIDSTTFNVYTSTNSMKALILNQVKMADLVIFNRCDSSMDRGYFRRNIKPLNRKAQIMYESADGTMDDQFEEELPFDYNQPVIELHDDDFGLWYLDAMDNPERYKGKKMVFTAQVYRGKNFADDLFVPGRFAMTCCAEDVQFIGFFCHAKGAKNLELKSWVKVTAKVDIETVKEYHGRGPVLYAEKYEPGTAPEEKIVYFT